MAFVDGVVEDGVLTWGVGDAFSVRDFWSELTSACHFRLINNTSS